MSQLPALMEQTRELSADKGYDSTENNEKLFDDHGIRPIIDKRHDWKSGDETRPLLESRADTVVYDVAGTVSCVCPATESVRGPVPGRAAGAPPAPEPRHRKELPP